MHGCTWYEAQETPRDVSWKMLRSLRHNPPGSAASGFRSRIFDASLEQAEQLFRAAELTGPQARPLLLFYGLSQAGRAISAAASGITNGEARLYGHGITVNDLAIASSHSLAQLEISPSAGSFSQVAKALGSTNFESDTSIGDPWGLLPGLERFPLTGAAISTPLFLDWSQSSAGNVLVDILPLPSSLLYVASDSATAARGSEEEWQAERARVTNYLKRYPSLAGFDFLNPTGPASLRLIGDQRCAITMTCAMRPGESPDDALNRHCVTYLGARFALRALNSNPMPPHPIVIWWAILYTLSMLARYQPDAWAKYVDVSKSPDAIPIEDLLDAALNVLPEAIYRAIFSVV